MFNRGLYGSFQYNSLPFLITIPVVSKKVTFAPQRKKRRIRKVFFEKKFLVVGIRAIKFVVIYKVIGQLKIAEKLQVNCFGVYQSRLYNVLNIAGQVSNQAKKEFNLEGIYSTESEKELSIAGIMSLQSCFVIDFLGANKNKFCNNFNILGIEKYNLSKKLLIEGSYKTRLNEKYFVTGKKSYNSIILALSPIDI